MDELQIKEAIMHPELDDDEVPERIIEVLDSEVKCEKVFWNLMVIVCNSRRA